MPAYLARVPLPLTLDAPVGRACDEAFAVFEAIERRAVAYGVPVDSRIVRGRNVRHALRAAGRRGADGAADRRRRLDERRPRRLLDRRHRLAAAQRARRGARSAAAPGAGEGRAQRR